MTKPSFVYVTYIATSPEKVWRALVDTDVMRKYWADPTDDDSAHENVSDWKVGSQWEHRRVDDAHGRHCRYGRREHPSTSLGYHMG